MTKNTHTNIIMWTARIVKTADLIRQPSNGRVLKRDWSIRLRWSYSAISGREWPQGRGNDIFSLVWQSPPFFFLPFLSFPFHPSPLEVVTLFLLHIFSFPFRSPSPTSSTFPPFLLEAGP